MNLPADDSVPPFPIQRLARHNVDEFSRFRAIIPRIYQEFGHSMVC